MKNIILISQSLTGSSFEMLKKHIDTLNSGDCFYVFHNFNSVVEVADVKSNYDAILNILRINGIVIRELDEYNLDEYFRNHFDGDIYITPTESTSVITSSASLLGYKGNVYVFSSSKNEPEITNLARLVRAFKSKDTVGIKGLDKTVVNHDYSKGSICHYTINGTKYTQNIKGKSNVLDSGVQGYTMVCDENPDYRIKIWDSFSDKYQYEIDEVESMISNKLAHPAIALPLAFVYNTSNEPIGFVMRNFSGKELDIHNLRKLKNPFAVVEQMLKAMLWMEAHDLYHRDVNHNMLISNDERLSVIDVDSIQYKAFPAIASASDPLNALPKKYSSSSLFYNTIDISYTTMAFIIAAIFDIEEFFGTWDETGLCTLNHNLLNKLRIKYPSIAKIVIEAYVNGNPVAVSRQLEVVRKTLSGDLEVHIDDFDFDEDGFNGDYPVDHDDDDEYNGDYPIDYTDGESYVDNFPNNFEPDRSSGTSSVSDKKAESKKNIDPKVNRYDGNEPNEFLYKLVWLFKKLVLSIFSSSTVLQGMTLEDEWREFVRSRKWVKPFVAASLAVVLMIVMVIAIIIM